MFRKTLLSCVPAALLLAPAANAATATFDTDAEGFTINGGSITVEETGGNPDGFLSIADTMGGFMELLFPQLFIDSVSEGATFSFDAQLLSSNGDGTPEFGILTVEGGGLSMSVDTFDPSPVPDVWTTSSAIVFDAATFGVSQADFETILGSITSLALTVETTFGVNETVGIDNVSIVASEVPVPTAALLMGSALVGFGVSRRRRKI